MVTSYPPKHCGIAEYAQELVSALRARGAEVIVAGDELSTSANLSVPLGSRKGLNALDDAVRAHRPDLVHLQWEPGLFDRGARRRIPGWLDRVGLPSVVSFHSLAVLLESSARGRASFFLSRGVEKRLARLRRAHFVVTTQKMAMLFASRYPGLAPERVPLGVASKRAPPSALSKKPSYLSFGFIGPGKRLEAVVDASKELPDRQFTIAGTPAGPRGEVYAAKLMADAKSLQNLRVVSNWLSDGDLDKLLEETTATVLPTTGDYRASAAYTRSISRGVPVIAIKGSSVGEPVEETGSGAVAEECSGPSIAAAIRHLESEFSRAAQGVAQAQEKYSWASVSRGLVDLYARAIAAPS